MKKRNMLIGVFLILIISILACGGSTVVVNTPIVNQPGNQPNPTSQAEPSPLPTVIPTVPVGTSRSNPAPVGSEIIVDNMGFIVTGVVRPADSIVSSGNMYNEVPAAGKEYMFVTLSVTCKKTSDQQCTLSSYNLKALGSDGILIDQSIMLAGVDGLLESFGTTFYGGANVTGNIAFTVTQGDTSILLVYQPFLGDSFYLALP